MSVSALCLNWNELNVARDSVRRLLKEESIDQVVLSDNGSTDGSKEYFGSISNPKFLLVSLDENRGPSVGRNEGIKRCTGDDIFLIDMDILYVPGTVAVYAKVLALYPDAFCVGQSEFNHILLRGHNGTRDPLEADIAMPEDYEVSDWFPMAWTQYGLWRGDILRKNLFYDKGAFGEQGYGFEDDWFFLEMEKQGLVSLSVNKPTYYHEAHSGIREIVRNSSRADLEKNIAQRRKIFTEKWGERKQWGDRLAATMPEKTTRPNPE